MPRLVGAQNPHRKVPRAARGGTHGVRVSQSSQHPSRTRPSATPRLILSASSFGTRSLFHPLPEPIPEGGRGRKGLVFFFNRGERNRPFAEPKPHKESGGMIRSRRPQVPALQAPARLGGGRCSRPCARCKPPGGPRRFPASSRGC
uniref:Uncharacterized protein n=1 Tax=Rousettus aegyptiacus TaxID=9407 RepID=A0A7J8INU2_ROUAE|nr:hypothetical protein HJG63_010707 [Rousettus aegyptiacus]